MGAEDFAGYGRQLEEAGVDVSTVLPCDDVGTATAFITTDGGGNQITAFFPGAMSRAGAIDLTVLDGVSEVVAGADASAAMAAHCEQAGQMGARLLFAPAQQIPALSDDQLRRGLELAWCVVGNDYELRMIEERTGVGVARLRQRCLVAVTLGERGSELHSPDGVVAIPAAAVSRVADPTGAGDAYIAGLLRGLRRDDPLEVAGRMGAVAAAFCVEHPGPQAHSFTTAEFEARYTAAFGSALPRRLESPHE